MRRAEDSAAPIYTLGQNLTGARVLLDVDEHGPKHGHRSQRRWVLGPEHFALRVQQLLQSRSGGRVVAESALCQTQIVKRAEGGRVFRAERCTSPCNHALV